MKKEYNSNMTIDEAFSRFRETMAPTANPFKHMDKEWVFRENFDGTYSIQKMVSSRTSSVYASLKVLPTEQGTRMILETDSMWKFFCLAALVWFVLSPVVIYISVRRGGDAGWVIFGVMIILFFTLLGALVNRMSEADLIDFLSMMCSG